MKKEKGPANLNEGRIEGIYTDGHGVERIEEDDFWLLIETQPNTFSKLWNQVPFEPGVLL